MLSPSVNRNITTSLVSAQVPLCLAPCDDCPITSIVSGHWLHNLMQSWPVVGHDNRLILGHLSVRRVPSWGHVGLCCIRGVRGGRLYTNRAASSRYSGCALSSTSWACKSLIVFGAEHLSGQHHCYNCCGNRRGHDDRCNICNQISWCGVRIQPNRLYCIICLLVVMCRFLFCPKIIHKIMSLQLLSCWMIHFGKQGSYSIVCK